MMPPSSEPVPRPSGARFFSRPPGRAVAVALLVALATMLFFWRLGDRGLWSAHEARAARVARTMLATGDWVVPRLSPDEPTYQKPPLYYWSVALASRTLTGGEVTPWTTRLPAAAAAALTVLVVILLGRRLKGHAAGLLAGLAMATLLRLMWAGRTATLDVPLTLLTTLALYGFLVAHGRRGRWWAYVPAMLPVGAALLVKGPIGAVVPAVVIVAFLAWQRIRGERGFWRSVGRLVPGAVVALAVAAPWYVAVHQRTGGDFTLNFVVFHHLARSGRIDLSAEPGPGGVEPEAASWWDYVRPGSRGYLWYRALADRGLEHREFERTTRWWHYLAQVWFNAFPWSIFLPGALAWIAVRRRHEVAERTANWLAVRDVAPRLRHRLTWLAGRGRWRFDPPMGFVVLWFVMLLALFSAMAFRKAGYLFPAYPAIAVLVAVFLVEYAEVRGWSRFWDVLLALGFGGLAAVGLGAAACLALLWSEAFVDWGAGLLKPDEGLVFRLAAEQAREQAGLTVAAIAAFVVGYGLTLLCWLRGHTRRALGMVGGATAVVMLFFVAVGVPVMDRGRSHGPFADRLNRLIEPDALVVDATGEDHQISFLFARPMVQPDRWLGEQWRRTGQLPIDAVVRAERRGRPAYLLVQREDWLNAGADPRLEVVLEERRPHEEPYVLVSPPPNPKE